MTWTIIAGEGARYRGQRRRVWSWVTPFGRVLWRDGSSVAWAPFRQSTEEYRAVWNGPKALFHFSVLLLCASEDSCQILLSFLVGREKPGIIIHIICPVSDSFAAVTAAAWQQLKVQHLLNGGSGPGNHSYVPSQNRELLRRSLAVLPSGCLRAVKDSHLGRHTVRHYAKNFLKQNFGFL